MQDAPTCPGSRTSVGERSLPEGQRAFPPSPSLSCRHVRVERRRARITAESDRLSPDNQGKIFPGTINNDAWSKLSGNVIVYGSDLSRLFKCWLSDMSDRFQIWVIRSEFYPILANSCGAILAPPSRRRLIPCRSPLPFLFPSVRIAKTTTCGANLLKISSPKDVQR